MRRNLRLAWLQAVWLVAAFLPSAAGAPAWDLTAEDLEMALERGDLDAQAYDRLLDLFRLRQTADSAADDSIALPTDIRRGDLDSLISSSAAALPSARGTAYEVYQPLRGTATRREWLLFAPEVQSLLIHWELSRSGAGEWRVLRRHAWWRSSRLSVVAGSFDVRWIDGLLIGAAPAFLHKRERFTESLLLPDRGRLNGVLCDLYVLRSRAAVIISHADDGELMHSAYGLSIAREYRGLQINTAYVHQILRRSGPSPGYSSGIWGLAAQRRGKKRFLSGALAIGRDDWAAQGRVDLAESKSHRLGVAVWRVGTRFRNPLLDGSAESDREPVHYPELNQTISSAGTGERGAEWRLEVGRPGRRLDSSLRYWREWPGRSASVRAVAGYELGRSRMRWRGEYRFYRRVNQTSAPQRHEWILKASRTHGYCNFSLRRTAGNWSPFGALGGRLEAGVRFGGGAGSRERQSLVLTYSDYDFARSRSAFWTVRSSQSLQFSRSVRLNVNLQWRTAYHAHPTEVSLRITTRGGP